MIYGIGIDVLEARRMQATFRRWGERIVERLLLPAERAQFARTRRPERFLGMRFAAKEAVVKAMGTGFAHGMWIRDVGVVQNAWGRPELVWSARGERLRRRLGIGAGHVTLTDEAGLIVAVAVLLKAGRRRAPATPAAATRRAVPARRATQPRRAARVRRAPQARR
ncbi:MAG: holo-ACP synthase [Gammaproteobacteria bacterium]|nr:holo-ACP synthase [Gammaproteobacteria bacterium]